MNEKLTTAVLAAVAGLAAGILPSAGVVWHKLTAPKPPAEADRLWTIRGIGPEWIAVMPDCRLVLLDPTMTEDHAWMMVFQQTGTTDRSAACKAYSDAKAKEALKNKPAAVPETTPPPGKKP